MCFVFSNCIGISYHVNFLGGLGSNEFHTKWRFGIHGSWKNSKSWRPFWSYQLNCQFGPFTKKSGKMGWIGSAVQLVAPKRPLGFWFFNCHGCQTFILYEIHCYLSPPKSWHNNSFLGSVSGRVSNSNPLQKKVNVALRKRLNKKIILLITISYT